MRKILLVSLLLYSISMNSQSIKIEKGVFYTIVENGVTQKKKIKFTISKETIAKIKTTDNYKATLGDKDFLNGNKVKRNITDPLVVHLYGLVNNSIIRTSWKLKNKTSLDFIEDSTGEIYLNDENEVIIKYYFKSKNDIGNELTSMSKYNDQTDEVYISN